MLKIGDFSRLVQVSVRMLHHYDDLRLLKPAGDAMPADQLCGALTLKQAEI